MGIYTVTSVEQTGEKEGKFGRMKELKLGLRNDQGIEKFAEWFTSVKTNDPVVGETIEGEVTNSEYGLKFAKPKAGSGGGFKRSPAETAAIQRQHSQEQALRREANLIAAGGRPFTEEQLRSVINWFEQDIKSKDRSVSWDGLSDDIPADQEGLPI